MQEAIQELREAIALCQCAEDAATEDHIRTTLGVAVGSLCFVAKELEYLQREAAGERTEASGM